jgi:hypothetical protein
MTISLVLTFAMMMTMTTTTFYFQSVNADECAEDKDWPEKPCPAYGAASEAELRERWDKYYEMKGKEWMEAKKAEMDQAIKNNTFTEWIQYGDLDNNNAANRNAYFYYRLNNQVPLMVRDFEGRYFMPEEQDPSMFIFTPLSGDYYVKPPPAPWYTRPEGLYVIIGIGSASALASFFALRKVIRK